MRSSSWNSATRDGTSSTVACRTRALPPLELRFALLEEGAQALLLVPGGEQREERLPLDPQPLRERVIGRRHRALGRGVGEQGPGGERSGLADGDAIDLVRRREPIDEPDRERLGGIHLPARQDQV